MSFFIAVKTAGVAIATLGFASFPAFKVILEGLLFASPFISRKDC